VSTGAHPATHEQPSAASDPLQGTKYRSLPSGSLGRGGMGEVVLAEHVDLGKQVVVKLLHAQLSHDPNLVQRMRLEARSLAALSSPHVVQVLDFGQTPAGRTYIVMERLAGRSLGAELRRRGSFPVEEAIGYVLQVLAGLEAAHAIGIIHRDIKPDNVFVCEGGIRPTLKILDFGIAKALDVDPGVGRPTLPQILTEAGGVVGTPRVAAPEQALGRLVDARTDVYATGLLLFTLVAGQGPFGHLTDPVDLLKAHVVERPPLLSAKAKQSVPRALDAVVAKALEKQPTDRYPSAEAFASDLQRVASMLVPSAAILPIPAPPSPGARHASESLSLHARGRRATPTARVTGWGTFFALAVLGAAATGLALAALSRSLP
jgi:eukaryotic-like serine/threonine-protein kinase